MSARRRYRYRVVTHAGAGLYSNEMTMPKALVRLADVAQSEEGVEIERSWLTPWGDHRYWLWRDGRWREYPLRAFDPSPADFNYWLTKARGEAS